MRQHHEQTFASEKDKVEEPHACLHCTYRGPSASLLWHHKRQSHKSFYPFKSFEKAPKKDKIAVTTPPKDDTEVEPSEPAQGMIDGDIDPSEIVLEAESLLDIKEESLGCNIEQEVEEVANVQMRHRCNACGFKAGDMVEMTGHLISKHVEEL